MMMVGVVTSLSAIFSYLRTTTGISVLSMIESSGGGGGGGENDRARPPAVEGN